MYRPPIWARTLAYSFSAPMALITVLESAEFADVALLAQPAVVTASTTAVPASAMTVRLPASVRGLSAIGQT